MKDDDKQGSPESALTAWRSSYYQLRGLERRLVDASRMGESPAVIERLFREVESLRLQTTEMFTVAQIESVSRHVMQFRATPGSPRTRRFSFETLSQPPHQPEHPAASRGTAEPKKRARRPAAAAAKPLAISSRPS
jgi:hypothetical protein